jgi:hypothetical protein
VQAPRSMPAASGEGRVALIDETALKDESGGYLVKNSHVDDCRRAANFFNMRCVILRAVGADSVAIR